MRAGGESQSQGDKGSLRGLFAIWSKDLLIEAVSSSLGSETHNKDRIECKSVRAAERNSAGDWERIDPTVKNLRKKCCRIRYKEDRTDGRNVPAMTRRN